MSKTCPKVYGILYTYSRSRFSTCSTRLKSHYDSLGITPKATQSDVKSAYYKLTKLYHPDKNKTAEAKEKFRDITDAYEVLGNYKSRKMYDRGMRPGTRHTDSYHQPQPSPEDDAQTRFYKAHMNKTRVPTAKGRTNIYNFDEWTQAHYGDVLNRRMAAKAECRDFEYKMQSDADFGQLRKQLLFVGTFIFISLGVAMSYTEFLEHSYDSNKLVSGRPASADALDTKR